MIAGKQCVDFLWFAGLACFMSVAVQGNEPTAPEIEANLAGYTTMYEAGLRVRPPKDFPEQGRGGFGNRDNKCVLMAANVSTPYYDGLDKVVLSQFNKKVLSREKVTVDGLPGILVHMEVPIPKSDPPAFRRHWHCVFGDETASWVVTGIYNPELPPLISASLRAAVLSAQKDNSPIPKPGERQPFVLEVSPKLKLVDTVWRQLVFTEDGKLPIRSGAAPIFTAGNFARRAKPPETREQFVERIREGERGMKQFEVQSMSDIKLDGLEGYEMQAKAVRLDDKTPVILYYVVLYTDGEFYVISATCGEGNSETYLPEFKAMAHSLKSKARPKTKS